MVVQESFGKLIHSFSETLEPYLGEIIPRLLINLNDKREKVSKSANLLMSSLIQRYGGDKLLKYFMNVIDLKEEPVVIAAALDVLSHHLIKTTDEYFSEKSNLKNIIKRIGSVISTYHKNEKFAENETIIMPAIASLLALRDINSKRTIKAIMSLRPDQLEIIQT